MRLWRSSAHWQKDHQLRGWFGGRMRNLSTSEMKRRSPILFVHKTPRTEAVWHYILIVNRQRWATYKQMMMSLFGIPRDYRQTASAHEPNVKGEREERVVRNRETKWWESCGSNLRCSSSSSAAIEQMPKLVRWRQCYGDNRLLNSRTSSWMNVLLSRTASFVSKCPFVSFFRKSAV